MFWLAASALSASAPASLPPRGIVVQARATVRILSGVQLKLDSVRNADAPPPRHTTIYAAGAAQPAQLIEFQ